MPRYPHPSLRPICPSAPLSSFLRLCYVQNSYESTSAGTKFGACLLPTTCVGLGANIISQFESSGAGLKLNALSDSPADDGFSMSSVYGMLVADTVL